MSSSLRRCTCCSAHAVLQTLLGSPYAAWVMRWATLTPSRTRREGYCAWIAAVLHAEGLQQACRRRCRRSVALRSRARCGRPTESMQALARRGIHRMLHRLTHEQVRVAPAARVVLLRISWPRAGDGRRRRLPQWQRRAGVALAAAVTRPGMRTCHRSHRCQGIRQGSSQSPHWQRSVRSAPSRAFGWARRLPLSFEVARSPPAWVPVSRSIVVGCWRRATLSPSRIAVPTSSPTAVTLCSRATTSVALTAMGSRRGTTR
mmetsp:Transcript_11084/g.28381  ORF Transcript_11084/g.28381 Transcript_11084/m.28381 type:complete len:260 (-) Transcript_11084:545-1324(-)